MDIPPVLREDQREILSVFATRDEAVATNNSDLFRSTQLGEIPHVSVEGYLSLARPKTEVLYQSYLDDSETAIVALVKEQHWDTNDKDEVPRTAFLLYSLAHLAVALDQNIWNVHRCAAA